MGIEKVLGEQLREIKKKDLNLKKKYDEINNYCKEKKIE